MMWFAIALAALAGLIVIFRVWRRYVEPWGEVDDLLREIVERRAPPKFLMTGNVHATGIGLNLEKLRQRLRELEERANEREFSVRAVFSAMPDGLIVVDEKRRVRMANRAFAEIFALREVAPGASLLELSGHAALDRLLTEAMQAGAPRSASLQIARGASEGRQLEVSALPMRETAAGARGAVVLFHDVTQVRQVEEMRRDFVANVSHELRTPLSIFRGYLETLLDDPQQQPDELIRILQVMERHSDRLNALVEDVLSLARLESPQAKLDLTEFDLGEFLHTVLGDWEARLRAREFRSELAVAPDLPALTADEGRLQEVIYNLLDNAAKYSSPGGIISVRAERVGDQIRLSVKDDGIGIRESDLPRIFERFYRGDKARSRALGGTGLGLAIVKHIAQLHGGHAEATSTFGRGTTVTVVLPIAGPRALAPAAGLAGALGSPRASVTESSH